MEVVQRRMVKWFRRDRSPSGSSTHSAPTSPTHQNTETWLRKKLKSGVLSSDEGEESDSAKYWSSAKTRRRLKHLTGAKRELPPLPPGAKSLRPPDLFPPSRFLLNRGVESPAHIYEEIPSWALDNSLDPSQTTVSEDTPMVSKDIVAPSGFSNAGFCLVGNPKTQKQHHHSYAQLAFPPMNSSPQSPKCNDVDLLKVSQPTLHSKELLKQSSVPRRPGERTVPPFSSDPAETTSLDSLDHIQIPVQNRKDFLHSDPGPHDISQEDNVDACYEYDCRRVSGNLFRHLKQGSDDSSGQFNDSSHSSFRSQDSSFRDRSESSNDTFSEYDLRSESSACDFDVDYDSMLVKIRDNLKLKADVQRLVCEGSNSDGATLTNASSMSEISTLADDEIDTLLNTRQRSHLSCRNLTSSSLVESTKPKRRVSQPAPGTHRPPPIPPMFHSVVDLPSMSEDTPVIHHRTASVCSLSKEDEGKLSCRVSTLRPDTIRKKRSTSRPPMNRPPQAPSSSSSRRYSAGSSNRLLADMVQRNHDRQTLLL